MLKMPDHLLGLSPSKRLAKFHFFKRKSAFGYNVCVYLIFIHRLDSRIFFSFIVRCICTRARDVQRNLVSMSKIILGAFPLWTILHSPFYFY